jgi:hypothetical protein
MYDVEKSKLLANGKKVESEKPKIIKKGIIFKRYKETRYNSATTFYEIRQGIGGRFFLYRHVHYSEIVEGKNSIIKEVIEKQIAEESIIEMKPDEARAIYYNATLTRGASFWVTTIDLEKQLTPEEETQVFGELEYA